MAHPLWELPPALSGTNQFWYWSYLANIHFVLLPPGADLFHTEHLWVLCVEEQFYLIWPLLVMWYSPKRLWRIALAGVACSWILRISGWLFWDWSGLMLYKMTFLRIDGMLAGASLAIYLRLPGFTWDKRSVAWVLLMSSVAGLLILGVPMRGLFRTRELLALGVPCLTLMCTSVMYLLLSDTSSRANQVLQHRGLCYLGQFSYALYLFQPFVIAWVKRFWRDDFLPSIAGSFVPGRLVYTLLVNGLTLGVAWLSWHLLEKRCLKLKAKIP